MADTVHDSGVQDLSPSKDEEVLEIEDSAGEEGDYETGDEDYTGSESESDDSAGERSEREPGVGQDDDEESQTLDDDQDKSNPAYIPRKGAFYLHDSRNDEATERPPLDRPGKKLWSDKEKWSHDKFDEAMQAPKSDAELFAIYGYDVRGGDKPPAAVPDRYLRPTRRGRGRRGGRGSSFGSYVKSEREDDADWSQDVPREAPPRGRGGQRGRGFNRGRGGRQFSRSMPDSPGRPSEPRPDPTPAEAANRRTNQQPDHQQAPAPKQQAPAPRQQSPAARQASPARAHPEESVKPASKSNEPPTTSTNAPQPQRGVTTKRYSQMRNRQHNQNPQQFSSQVQAAPPSQPMAQPAQRMPQPGQPMAQPAQRMLQTGQPMAQSALHMPQPGQPMAQSMHVGPFGAPVPVQFSQAPNNIGMPHAQAALMRLPAPQPLPGIPQQMMSPHQQRAPIMSPAMYNPAHLMNSAMIISSGSLTPANIPPVVAPSGPVGGNVPPVVMNYNPNLPLQQQQLPQQQMPTQISQQPPAVSQSSDMVFYNTEGQAGQSNPQPPRVKNAIPIIHPEQSEDSFQTSTEDLPHSTESTVEQPEALIDAHISAEPSNPTEGGETLVNNRDTESNETNIETTQVENSIVEIQKETLSENVPEPTTRLEPDSSADISTDQVVDCANGNDGDNKNVGDLTQKVNELSVQSEETTRVDSSPVENPQGDTEV